jgi:hypothetical protein
MCLNACLCVERVCLSAYELRKSVGLHMRCRCPPVCLCPSACLSACCTCLSVCRRRTAGVWHDGAGDAGLVGIVAVPRVERLEQRVAPGVVAAVRQVQAADKGDQLPQAVGLCRVTPTYTASEGCRSGCLPGPGSLYLLTTHIGPHHSPF